MNGRVEVTIFVNWKLNDDEAVNPKDEIFDSQGRRWIVSYYSYYSDSDEIQFPLEEALRIARSSPTGEYRVCCEIPHACSVSVRQLIGDFYDACQVKLHVSPRRGCVHKTILSLAGIEEFPSLTHLRLDGRTDHPNEDRYRVDILLEGIEFCGNLKYVRIKEMNVQSSVSLEHLDLEYLDLRRSLINDLCAVRSKKIKVESAMLPSLKVSHEPSSNLQSVLVELGAPLEWEALFQLDDLETEFKRMPIHETEMPVVTRLDLVNRLEHCQVIVRFCHTWFNTIGMRTEMTHNLISLLVGYSHEKFERSRKARKPIIAGNESPEMSDILNRLSKMDTINPQLTFRELSVLCHHFEINRDPHKLLHQRSVWGCLQ